MMKERQYRFRQHHHVQVNFPCGFKTRGFIVGYAADIIGLNALWIVDLVDDYPGHPFSAVVVDESCIEDLER